MQVDGGNRTVGQAQVTGQRSPCSLHASDDQLLSGLRTIRLLPGPDPFGPPFDDGPAVGIRLGVVVADLEEVGLLLDDVEVALVKWPLLAPGLADDECQAWGRLERRLVGNLNFDA